MAWKSVTFAAKAENILLVVLDDAGAEQFKALGQGFFYAQQPTLDFLFANGVAIRNGFTYPICSPTRATFLTGRFGFRTGIGDIVNFEANDNQALLTSERTLPEALDLGTGFRYEHACVGKWHLGNASVGGYSAPNIAGFCHFAGTMENILSNDPLIETYYNYPKVVDGVERRVRRYITRDTIDDAIRWVSRMDSPWLLYLPLNAPHTPLDRPPSDGYSLASYSLQVTTLGLNMGSGAGVPVYPIPTQRPVSSAVGGPWFKAMIEYADGSLDRLLAAIPEHVLAKTMVVLISDNGTENPILAQERYSDGVTAYQNGHGKRTLFNPGIQTPMVFFGAGVVNPGRIVDDFACTADLFTTILDLCDADPALYNPGGTIKIDGLSLRPVIEDTGPSPRSTYFAESFANQVDPPQTAANRAIGGIFTISGSPKHMKLLRVQPTPTDSLYNLTDDPRELNNLLAGSLTPDEQAAYTSLQASLAALLAS